MSAIYEAVPASILHIKPLSMDLRPASCTALRGFGLDPRRALLSAFRASAYSRTAMIDGLPVAMWGTQGVMLSNQITIWAAFSNAATKFPLAMVRNARSELRAMADKGNRIYAAVSREDERAMVFAETIGFRNTDEIPAAVGMLPMVYRGQQRSPILDGERPPFIIHGLGRSRTAWLAAFLSYGKWTCLHEQAVNLKTVSDIGAMLSKHRTGYAETAAHFGWPLIVRSRPDIRQVVIARPVEDAITAMAMRYENDGILFDASALRAIFLRADRTLKKISALPNTLTIPFEDLETEDGCRRVFEFCIPYKWDRDWWMEMRGKFIESDLAGFVERYNDDRSRVDGLKRALKLELFRTVRADALN